MQCFIIAPKQYLQLGEFDAEENAVLHSAVRTSAIKL